MKILKPLFVISLIVAFLLSVKMGYSQNLEGNLDKLIAEMYIPEEPGATFLIAKNGKPIYRKAFGMANLELNVAMTPENIFEIGSITKQFTAVAILMLEEQGKLKVEDPITKFIEDYPTQGKTITVHNLLNHTSGIKSYTNMPSFITLARTDMEPTELIEAFKNEPMDFDPGEKFLYNNSGYILLGHIIEVVSGMSYEDFIEKNIFSKIGMDNSYYGSMKEIIKNRASGYQTNNEGFVNADYLSLTLPYAAGSIMSNVDDLLKWQNAITNNTFIKRETLNKAINGSTLNDATEIPYGYGWGKGDLNGSTTISHGGGIFGYTTHGMYLPEEDVYVIGLSNCNCKDINTLTTKVAATSIGKPFPNKSDAIKLSSEQLKKWTGTYKFTDQNTHRYITFNDGKLTSQREGSTVMEIYPLSETRFIFEDGTTEYNFEMNNKNKQVIMKTQAGQSIGVFSDKKAPAAKSAINIDAEVLKKYEGKYTIQPNFILTIFLENGKLMTQATGQDKIEIFAEDETHFFAKVIPATITFNRGDSGEVESLTLAQGGQTINAEKME